MLLAAMVCMACPSRAQQQPAPTTNDGKPVAVPARPTITNPAHIPLPGYLQSEQGLLQANSSIEGDRRQFSLVQTTKLALSHYLMVAAADQPFANTLLDASASPSERTASQNDTGDLELGGQVLFTDVKEGYGLEPTVAIAYQHVVRGGTAPDIDIGGSRQGITLLASGQMAGLHYDTNYVFNEQINEVDDRLGTRIVRRAQFGQSLSVTRQITKSFGITGELWHFTQPFITASVDGSPVARANAIGLLIAPAYNLRDNLVLDCGFAHGLTSTSTSWEGFAGFTYLLPRRLWPEKR
jgi:hypothetical protein